MKRPAGREKKGLSILARQVVGVCRRVSTFALAALGGLAAVPALADEADASCGFAYLGGYSFADSKNTDGGLAAANCADTRFGTIASSAFVNGTRLGSSVGIDWSGNPPARVPDDSYAGTARALLIDNMLVPGVGRGVMTVSLPVKGIIVQSPYFDLLTKVVVQAGDYDGSDSSNIWQGYFSNSVNKTFLLPLSFPFGESFSFFTGLYLWGGEANGLGSNYTDGIANFSNTVEVSVTRLQDAAGIDIPLSALQVSSGREFVAGLVPEPHTWALLLAGLGLLGLAAHRRRALEEDRRSTAV